MLRGLNDHLYFVRKDEGAQSDTLNKVKIELSGDKLVYQSH